jgi:hypothetical protein
MMECRDFSRESFELYPVWRWNASSDAHCPVIDFDPLPEDESTLFIKATFTAATGEVFDGYLVGLTQFFAFGLFLDNEEFVVNLRLVETTESVATALRRKYGKSIRLFPLKYHTRVHFAGEECICGTLEFP